MRRPIHVSWERSRAARVDADRPAPSYVGTPQDDSVLVRAARPVIEALAAELGNEPVSLLLTDPQGVVILRSGGDPSLLKALDAVDLAPGFSYAEGEVGTNGIGTALEVGAAIHVDGAEHYTGGLCAFSCAGALVHHPVTGALLGVVDITASSADSNPLLLSFAKLAAERIQERILTEASALDTALLSDYYLACQRSGGGVIALGDEMIMMNSLMQQHFDATDQAAIIDLTRDSRGRLAAHTMVAELPSGVTARLSYQPTFVVSRLAGGIVSIREHRSRPAVHPTARIWPLPGVAGQSAVWRHSAQEVVTACARREWIVVEGEVGSGKAALVRAAHEQTQPGRHLTVLDAGSGTSPRADGEFLDRALAELESGADLLVRHAHDLTGEDLVGFAQLLQSLHDGDDPQGPWIALTTVAAGPDEAPPAGVGTRLLGFFPRTVVVPPLRHHLTDVPVLVRHLLDQAGVTDLRLSSAALNQLMRLPWPGNVRHLRAVLATVVRRRRAGEVGLEDLPAECRSTIRRQLTSLETIERDAIVDALAINRGDKAAAAASLGMSRATIYRKIRHFGIQL